MIIERDEYANRVLSKIWDRETNGIGKGAKFLIWIDD